MIDHFPYSHSRMSPLGIRYWNIARKTVTDQVVSKQLDTILNLSVSDNFIGKHDHDSVDQTPNADHIVLSCKGLCFVINFDHLWRLKK